MFGRKEPKYKIGDKVYQARYYEQTSAAIVVAYKYDDGRHQYIIKTMLPEYKMDKFGMQIPTGKTIEKLIRTSEQEMFPRA